MDQYDKAKFEAAFQLTTAVANQIIRVDFEEMKRWINNLMSPKTVEGSPDFSPETAKNLDNLIIVMDQFQTMKDTLFENGVPIRNVEHYRKEHSKTNHSGDGGVIGQQSLGKPTKE